jgi:hypothetical protein
MRPAHVAKQPAFLLFQTGYIDLKWPKILWFQHHSNPINQDNSQSLVEEV